MTKSNIERALILIAFIAGFVGIVQYLGVTAWLMSFYPGGNLADRGSVGYDFFRNFLSDLGRTNAFRNGPNPTAPYYAGTLALAGASTIIFFTALSHYLFYASRNWWAIPLALTAIVAGAGYIGVAFNPINLDYHSHITYVQIGFIGFWMTCVFGVLAIRNSPVFDNRYAQWIGIFMIILGVQIVIMLFGPRSWSDEYALLLQVTAQKIVVYSEIIVMLGLCVGAMMSVTKKSNE